MHQDMFFDIAFDQFEFAETAFENTIAELGVENGIGFSNDFAGIGVHHIGVQNTAVVLVDAIGIETHDFGSVEKLENAFVAFKINATEQNRCRNFLLAVDDKIRVSLSVLNSIQEPR